MESPAAFWTNFSLDGSFSASVQVGYILETRQFWQLRFGLFGTFQLSQQNNQLGMTYGFYGAYRYSR